MHTHARANARVLPVARRDARPPMHWSVVEMYVPPVQRSFSFRIAVFHVCSLIALLPLVTEMLSCCFCRVAAFMVHVCAAKALMA